MSYNFQSRKQILTLRGVYIEKSYFSQLLLSLCSLVSLILKNFFVCFLLKFSKKHHSKSFHFQHQFWGPKHNILCQNLLLRVNSPQTISKFIFQIIFTKLLMLFFIVWKNRRQFRRRPVSVLDKWTFSLTLCVRETENIIGFECGSLFLEMV